jgi:quinoprotein glucose dehydrogenase
MHRTLLLAPFAVAAIALSVRQLAADPPAEKAAEKPRPRVAEASDEGRQALKRFRMPEGITASLWAAEPLLANPVCFCFDEKGRCFVAETFRLHKGVTDNRGHMDWLDDDLASRTVADRVAMYRKYLKDAFPDCEKESDQVRLIEDTKGLGVADKSTVFADGFHHAADGIGAGLLARKGKVWYTCIPDLWLLRDTKGSGKADEKTSLSNGYGIHVAFLGHDLHGLRPGPDGRLYFSLGDRGLNVTNKEGKKLFNPDSGAVLRCDPDGSNLEIFATGLRNPQELAFDDLGNLFTVDNNSDSGDKARLVYVVEGGDSGWRTGYQYGSSLSNRGPFNAEKLWHLQHPGQPAYIVPPLAHIADGPSGLCFNYGAVALPEQYARHFFLADFRGSGGISGIRSFAVQPKGAAFEITDRHQFIWSILATDCDFGPDGGFYVSDWTQGWELTGKGRIYRFADAASAKNPAVAEVKHLLAEGFDRKTPATLVTLLGHADMRVRQEAQFALAARECVAELAAAAGKGGDRLTRLHGIWGLGQVGRKNPTAYDTVQTLLADPDSEVRASAARVLGDGRVATAASALIALLKDGEPRVRFFAAQALGRIGSKECVKPVLELLKENADQDTYLRHAAVMALAGSSDGAALLAAGTDESPFVRVAIVLALRRLGAPELARFLTDADPGIADEAARAIHDTAVVEALPALAARLEIPHQSELLHARALNARFRLGRAEDANAVAHVASRGDYPEKLRVQALRDLSNWSKPGRRDNVTGLTQNLGTRSGNPAVEAVKQNLVGIFAGPEKVREEAAKTCVALAIKEAGPKLMALFIDPAQSAEARVQALRGLSTLEDPQLDRARDLALAAAAPCLKTEGRRLLALARPADALKLLANAIRTEDVRSQQGAYSILGDYKGLEADEVLTAALDRLLKGELQREVHLDLLEAATKRSAEAIQERLARYEAARAKGDHLAAYREALAGGEADAGRRIFATRAELSCVRCHKINGEGGEVGPDLTGVGSRQNREYLLESIVDPNKQITKGFETVVVTLKSGKSVVGVLKSEDARELRLMTAEGKPVVVPKAEIDERDSGKSAMPEDLIKHLSKAELRDLVEYLASLKETKVGEGKSPATR